jgi:hypothetical protein
VRRTLQCPLGAPAPSESTPSSQVPGCESAASAKKKNKRAFLVLSAPSHKLSARIEYAESQLTDENRQKHAPAAPCAGGPSLLAGIRLALDTNEVGGLRRPPKPKPQPRPHRQLIGARS